MRVGFVTATAALQVLVLGYMAGQREWVVRTGRVIYLRTAPVDPRDVMRGDYVRLDYEIAHVPREMLRDGLATDQVGSMPRRETRVYASLQVKDDGVGELVSLSDRRPREGLFLRGRVEGARGDPRVPVRYGVEAYFMEQGKALELEESRRRPGVQVPLDMEVAVSPGGLAVLKGPRWSPLGIGLELDNTAAKPGGIRLARGAVVRLLNTSDKAVAIVELSGGRSLALVSEGRWRDNPWHWVHEGESPPVTETGRVIVLRPGQSHELRVDFSDPYWFVRASGIGASAAPTAVSLTQLTDSWGHQFRLVYRAPDSRVAAALPNAKLIWHGRLPSRAFTPMGRVD